MALADKLLIFILLLTVVSTIANAIPVPFGISGTIYKLDGITPVPEATDFSITNIRTGISISGSTRGANLAGYYSAAIDGFPGDIIEVRAWTEYNNVVSQTIVNGVLRGFDLLLNTSTPNLPPIILSVPETEIYANNQYVYEIIAEDPEDQPIEIIIIKSPENMDFNGNTIEWLPRNPDEGDYEIKIIVSDGELSTLQIFTLTVFPPNADNKGKKKTEVIFVKPPSVAFVPDEPVDQYIVAIETGEIMIVDNDFRKVLVYEDSTWLDVELFEADNNLNLKVEKGKTYAIIKNNFDFTTYETFVKPAQVFIARVRNSVGAGETEAVVIITNLRTGITETLFTDSEHGLVSGVIDGLPGDQAEVKINGLPYRIVSLNEQPLEIIRNRMNYEDFNLLIFILRKLWLIISLVFAGIIFVIYRGRKK